ncbi:MAG: NAD-binding protein, partial [Dehalococcoidia bacterium]|nr:NAD-binding protein [Dehalococcoidia bacterium]
STPRADIVAWDSEIPSLRTKSELLDEICRLITNLLDGLGVAHQQHVIHGFIRPCTIVRYNGRYCLIDFALPARAKLPVTENIEARSFRQTQSITGGVTSSIHTDLQGIGLSLREILGVIEDDSIKKDTLFQQLDSLIGRLIEETTSRQFKSVQEVKDELTRAMNVKIGTLDGLAAETKTAPLIGNEPLIIQPEVAARIMPLLAKATMGMDKSAFRDVIVLHINHCAEDLFTLNQVLCSLGATIVFVAVPYGNSSIPWPLPYVVYHSTYSQEGFKLHRNSMQLGHIAPNLEDAVRELIVRALENEIKPLVNSFGKRLLIVEDGGYHYSILDDIKAEATLPAGSLIGAVEQTASGSKRCARYSRTKGLPYPVITVARSDVKMRFETYFIARRIVDELNHLLYQANDFLSFHNLIVIGYGIIGRSITTTLSGMNCQISVIDTDPEIRNLAREEGYHILETIPASAFDRRCVVIGATGESSFTLSMLTSFLESESSNVYLASASSKRIEFAELIEFFEGSFETRNRTIQAHPALGKVSNIEIESNQVGITYHFRYKGKRKSLIMIAEGYPVNFYRPQTISLTPAIMDPIVTEIALCCEHLACFSNSLEHILYLLGGSQIPNLDIDEEQMISEWLKLNELSPTSLEASAWDYFRIHPLEDRLRAKCLEIDG